METTVGEALRSSINWAGIFKFALITTVDSTPDIRAVPIALTITQEISAARFVGGALLVPTTRITEVSERFKLFTGFDEVWFYINEPLSSKPAEISLVAPLDLEVDSPPNGLAQWFAESGCRLGIGDGIGMNFATLDKGIASKMQQLAVIARS